MRKLVFPLALLGVAFWAAAPSGAAPAGDSVHGGGQFLAAAAEPECETHFSVNARSGSLGEDPRGNVHYGTANCGSKFKAEVVCVRVVGNQASVLAEFTKTKFRNPTFEGGGIRAFYEDNGNPSGGVPDRQQVTRLTADEFAAFRLLGCPPPIEPRTPLTHGNIHITDG